MAKPNNRSSGLVYSTDPTFKLPAAELEQEEILEPGKQSLKIKLETKHRAGKAVTLVDNFSGPAALKEDLGKKLKAFCGTGGSVKDGEIIIQGDHRDKVLQWLHQNGYVKAKRI